jgi:hypothetical protein
MGVNQYFNWASHKTKVKKSSPIIIPSSYLYKLSQSSNHEIKDYYYNEGIAQKHAFWL